ncbi:hypothetical protein DESACE_07675 [Desulfurella acetivorans A63]|nr:hypothetical protein DESACE_07675 [Desulfurella acetivorans A63]
MIKDENKGLNIPLVCQNIFEKPDAAILENIMPDITLSMPIPKKYL